MISELFGGAAIALFVGGLALALVGEPSAGAWIWLAAAGAAFLGTGR